MEGCDCYDMSVIASGLFLPFFDCSKKGKPLRLEQKRFCPRAGGHSHFLEKRETKIYS